jgi:hypothetical protein
LSQAGIATSPKTREFFATLLSVSLSVASDLKKSPHTYFCLLPPRSALSTASLAYNSAVDFFSSELTHDECKRIWLRDKVSMHDVKAAADDAQKAYESRSRKSKAQQYLAAFSSRLMYYGVIMDTLSQHHPEYVSLAWGAVKFLFVVRYLRLDYITMSRVRW